MNYVIAIDPGTKESGVCIIDKETYKPLWYAKVNNQDVMFNIMEFVRKTFSSGRSRYEVVVEMVASYGMPVGAEVFETCVWIGRFMQTCFEYGYPTARIFRQDEKINLCHSNKANDSTIIQALVDRFRTDETDRYAKGTAKKHGWFWKFAKDVWSAYAVAVTYVDMQKAKELKNEQ